MTLYLLLQKVAVAISYHLISLVHHIMEISSDRYTEVSLPGAAKTIVKYTEQQMQALNRFAREINFFSAEPLMDRLAFAIAFREPGLSHTLFSSTGISQPASSKDFVFEGGVFALLLFCSLAISTTLLLPLFAWIGYVAWGKIQLIYQTVDGNKALINTLATHWLDNAEYYKAKHQGSSYADESSKSFDEMGRALLDFIEGKNHSRTELMSAIRILCYDINFIKETELNIKKDHRFAQLNNSNTEQAQV